MLFPRDQDDYEGFKDYFLSCRGWFFGLSIAWRALDVAHSWFKDADHSRNKGREYFVIVAIYTVLAVGAILTRNQTARLSPVHRLEQLPVPAGDHAGAAAGTLRRELREQEAAITRGDIPRPS
jgi:hypothetical protein